jgi:hypothetical protein
MNDIRIGVRVSIEAGLQCFGIDEVNEAIRAGYVVSSIAPGGAIMEKGNEDADTVRVKFAGYSMVVSLSPGSDLRSGDRKGEVLAFRRD